MKRIWFALDFLVAAGVAMAVEVVFPESFTNSEQYFLGLLLFVALLVAQTLYVSGESFDLAARLTERRDREFKVWEVRNNLDQHLQEVRRLFHEVEEERQTEVDLFYEYQFKKLLELEASLRDSCSKREIQIDETMFAVTTWLLDSSFLGRESDILRAVMPSVSIDFFFDLHTKRYFYQMFELIRNGRSKGVKRLIVLDSPEALEDVRMQRLVAFHNSVEGYSCRSMERGHFNRIVRDYKLHHLVRDFGIYGTSYLYKGLADYADEIVGLYSKDSTEITIFTQCFESCWESATSVSTQTAVPVEPTVDWVFGGPAGLGTGPIAEGSSRLAEAAGWGSDEVT